MRLTGQRPQPRWWFAALIAWTVLTLWIGQRPAEALPDPGFRIPGQDKVVHFVLYGVMGFVAVGVRRGEGTRAVGEAVAWAALVGALDETLQGALGRGRSPEFLDWLADVGGAAVFALAARAWWQRPRGDGASRHR